MLQTDLFKLYENHGKRITYNRFTKDVIKWSMPLQTKQKQTAKEDSLVKDMNRENIGYSKGNQWNDESKMLTYNNSCKCKWIKLPNQESQESSWI